MGRHNQKIQQLKAANARDAQEAQGLMRRLQREAATLSVADTIDITRKVAQLGDRQEARADEIARLEGEE